MNIGLYILAGCAYYIIGVVFVTWMDSVFDKDKKSGDGAVVVLGILWPVVMTVFVLAFLLTLPVKFFRRQFKHDE